MPISAYGVGAPFDRTRTAPAAMMLTFAILALLVGAAAYPLSKRSASLMALLDGFALVSVGGLSLLHILPESISEGGWPAALAAALGSILPASIERWAAHDRKLASQRALIALALVGLFAHALVDGSALALDARQHGQNFLGLAVVLHGLPVGLGIAWLVPPRYAPWGSFGIVGVLGFATAIGYLTADAAIVTLPATVLACFEAFVAATLMHVIADHPLPHAHGRSRRFTEESIGGLAGLAVVAYTLMGGADAAHVAEGGAAAALSLLQALALPYGAGIVLAIALQRVGLPRSAARRDFVRTLWCAVARAPVGSPEDDRPAGQAGSPLRWGSSQPAQGASIGLTLATGGLHVTAPLMHAWLFGGLFSAAHWGASAALCVGAAYARGTPPAREPSTPPPACASTAPVPPSLALTIGQMGSWALAGFILAALVEVHVAPTGLSTLSATTQLALAVALASLGSVDVIALAPLLWVLCDKGLAPGAAFAVALLGPLPTARHLAQRLRLPIPRARGIAIVWAVCGLALGALLDAVGVRWTLGEPLLRPWSPAQAAGALVSIGAAAWALLRFGPRAALGEVVPTHDHTRHLIDTGQPHAVHVEA